MGSITPNTTLLPPDSLILVTGVNGLIASHVASQILQAGHRVRGTVRNLTKSAWIGPLFSSRHGRGRFELVEVADLGAPGIWDAHLCGVSGVAAVAGSADLGVTDVDAEVASDRKAVVELLGAAEKAGVKSFVLTGSAWAAWTPQPNVPITVEETTYNERAVNAAMDSSLSRQKKGIFPFMAVKVKLEQAVWKWVALNKPSFAFCTMLLDTVLGPILDPQNQPASTSGMVRWLWEGKKLEILQHVAPQWFIDGRDVGRLYLAALTFGDLSNGKRIFGCAERYSWAQVLEIMKEEYPEKKDWANLPDPGTDMATLPLSSADRLFKAIGTDSWIGLRKSVRDTVGSFKDLSSAKGIQG